MIANLKYITVIAVAIGLTLVSAMMTISGYLSLYAGRTIIISALFIILELAKATIFGIVFVYADKKYKPILLTLATALIVLSFMGHTSYLNHAYASNKVEAQVSREFITQTKDTHDTQLKDLDFQIQLLREQIQQGKDEIQSLTDTATGLQTANARNWALGTNKRRIKEIQDTNLKLSQDIKDLYAQKKSLLNDSLQSTKDAGRKQAETTNRSVFQYTADMFGTTQDKLASVINFILALVIDTLALTMLWVSGEMWKQRKRYNKRVATIKENELKELQKQQTPQEVQDNLEQYLFNGKSVQDVIGMNDSEVAALKTKVKTKAQLDWLNFALELRKQQSDFQYSELK